MHMGIDTVELEGTAFDVKVKEGDTIEVGQSLARMYRNKVEEAGKDTSILVVFTNLNETQTLEIEAEKEVKGTDYIGRIK